ncbi:MAG: S41 family peptidase [Myxococcota bacterium]
MRAIDAWLVIWTACTAGLWACGNTQPEPLPDAGLVRDAGLGQDALAGDAESVDAGQPIPDAGTHPPSNNWCDRLRPAPLGSDPVLEALSLAHARVRYFGFQTETASTDRALASILNAEDGLRRPALEIYAGALVDVCASAAETKHLGPAEVRVEGTRATVVPGSGPVLIPEAVTEIVLDLRAADDRESIEAAARAAFDAPIARGQARVRRFNGLPDEVFAPAEGSESIYTNELVDLDLPLLEGTRSSRARVVLWTDLEMSAPAAEIAGAIRLQKKAFLLGGDVLSRVAESRADAIGQQALRWRERELFLPGGRRWPDLIRADATDLASLDDLFARAEVPDPAVEGDDRASLAVQPLRSQPRAAPPLDRGTARAAVLVAHGAARLFFAYFEEVGRDIDTRLVEVLAALDAGAAVDRHAVFRSLGRMSNALHDAHSFTQDAFPTRTPGLGVFPVWVEHHGSEAWVRQSGLTSIRPGDVITRFDGRDLDSVFSSLKEVLSYATPENADFQAAYSLLSIDHPVSVELRDTAGLTKTIEVSPQTSNTLAALDFHDTERHSGWLGDLGAPNVYYVQLEGTLTRPAELLAAVQMATTATAVIVDMRGYPWDFGHPYTPAETQLQFEAYGLLFGANARSALFHTPIWSGPDDLVWEESQYNIGPSTPGAGIHAPMAVLVGPGTQSSAEDFVIYLRDAHPDIRIVGRPSSGTDGNITGLILPGGFAMTFTGLNVKFPDGQRFHGVGHVPTHLVEHHPEDFAAGVDRDLLEALGAW